VAAAGGAVALLTMMAVSRSAGATLSAQLGRGLAAGVGFAVAVLAAVTVVRWLGESAESPADAAVDRADATNASYADTQVQAAALAAASAAESPPPPTETSPASEEFAPLVVPRLSAGAGRDPIQVAGVSDD
jgi:hypothetical protein